MQCYLVARAVHVLSLGVILGRTELLADVEHGLECLRGPLRDAERDGWTSFPGGGEKLAYDHAFVLLAAATATAAAAAGARELLEQALEVWEARFWDESAGAVVDRWDRAWQVLDGYRGANANMHTVEALLAVADVMPERAAVLRDRAERMVRRFVHDEARTRDWRLPEHFDAQWTALPHFGKDDPSDPFRPYGVTVGHQFEWARLCLHLEAALADQAPGWLRTDAVALYAAAERRGWRADGQDGFVYTLDWEDQPVVSARMHWVLAEAIAAASVLGSVTGLPSYRTQGQVWAAHAAKHFVDEATGCWHHELDPDGTPAAGTWSGQPDTYHVFQALLLTRLPVRGSVAAALIVALPRPGTTVGGASSTGLY
ncbi:MAG: N-acylglucosamine 2-epimerase [Frankiales bacterium]|nr:N-acylglucosamine 2-epimerase [Frankiales bacterium]